MIMNGVMLIRWCARLRNSARRSRVGISAHIFICGLVFFAAFSGIYAYAAENKALKGTHEITGRVTAIDWVASLITVAYPDNINDKELDITFLVPAEAVIYRGTDKISLSDIQEDDVVTVQYMLDDSKEFKALAIFDTNEADS